MKKLGWTIIILISLIAVFFSGCTEQPSTEVKPAIENVELESNLVQLVYGKLIQYRDGEVVSRVEVEYRFKNIANKDLGFSVDVELYDKNNQLLFTGGHKEINLPSGWEEHLVNSVSYNGIYASEVDHAKLIVTERS